MLHNQLYKIHIKLREKSWVLDLPFNTSLEIDMAYVKVEQIFILWEICFFWLRDSNTAFY